MRIRPTFPINLGTNNPFKDGNIVLGSIFRNILLSFFGAGFILYVLFQKKLLPKSIGKVVSKVLFYPTFPLTAALRIGNYWTDVDQTVVLGCAPMGFWGHPKKMYQMGVRGVLNMCYEYSGPQSYYAELGLRQLRLPVIDHVEPSLEYIKEAMKFIQLYQEKGQRVYVHCKAGHGRAAAIAMCWMIRTNPSLTPKELNAILCTKRHVRPTLYKQANIIRFYEESQAAAAANSNSSNNKANSAMKTEYMSDDRSGDDKSCDHKSFRMLLVVGK